MILFQSLMVLPTQEEALEQCAISQLSQMSYSNKLTQRLVSLSVWQVKNVSLRFGLVLTLDLGSNSRLGRIQC